MTRRHTACPRTDEQSVERTAWVPTRLGEVHVRTTGEGATTILWPSMFVDSHSWDLLMPLMPAGRRYVLVDPPGLGLSQPLQRVADISTAAAAATDLLDELGVDGPVDWVGNAFGGHVGYELGTRPGVLRSLVAVSSPTEPVPSPLRRQINLLLPLLRAAGPVGPVRDAVMAGMLTDVSAAQEEIRRIVIESLTRPTRRSLSLAVRSFILNRLDVTAELEDLAIPSLFVASDDRGDWSPEAAESAAALAPSAEFVVVCGARTLIPLEQPEVLASHLLDFWNRLR
jgi:pimeloyl-ACP methyl ester carboxylesterase